MQTTDTKNLPKRSRYYQGMVDLNLIERGTNYKQLNKSHIIFICTFDPFGEGRHIYTFENICLQDTQIHLSDEATKVFLNPYSDMNDVSEELENFLNYLAGKPPVDEFTKQLDEAVKVVKENRKWRREYMTLSMKYEEKLEEGFELGRAEGALSMLFSLVDDGVLSEVVAAQKANMSIDEFIQAKADK